MYIMEIGAAVAGTIYLRRSISPVPYSRLFVWYLWFVVVVEIIGFYPAFNYFTDFSYMPVLKDTVFERNIWMYNIYSIITFTIYYVFFIAQLQNEKSKKIFKWFLVFFVLSAMLNLILSDVFYERSSAYTFLIGIFILLPLIFVYYFELLKSDRILFFYRSLAFYISVGLLLWQVTITPLFIYNKYFTSASPEFVSLHSIVLRTANVFLYGVYIFGFLVCSRSQNRLVTSETS